MAARGAFGSHAGEALYDAVSLAIIVGFWLGIIVAMPWLAADFGVPPGAIGLATVVSVTAYLGMRWWTESRD
ncbi:MAG: hypothetical protein ACOC0X_01475 [Halobacteriota archaeon]